MPSRRQVLGTLGLVGAGAYIHHRGLRYPRMGFEPPPLSSVQTNSSGSIRVQDAIFTPGTPITDIRAVGLEPVVEIEKNQSEELNLTLGNISQKAILKFEAPPNSQVIEHIEGIKRTLQVIGSGRFVCQWFLPEQDGANFAVMGDTGAGLELEWVLERVASQGADFLLHLGDFHYVDGEYERAIELFNQAAIPCFVSIGNHDFNDSGLVYDRFLTSLGPLNHAFEFAGVQFICIDTAADFFPAYSGLRGDLLRNIEQSSRQFSDKVCFTHRNFLDPRPGRDHNIGGVGERPWLADQLLASGVTKLLTGHVHHSAEMEYRGVHQFTVGEGLGFEDIVHEKLVAKFLMGRVERGQAVTYEWRDLLMPWAMHTSPEHEEKLLLEHPPEKLEWYRKKIAQS